MFSMKTPVWCCALFSTSDQQAHDTMYFIMDHVNFDYLVKCLPGFSTIKLLFSLCHFSCGKILWGYANILFLIILCPVILVSTVPWYLPNGGFSISIILSVFISGNSTGRKEYSFSLFCLLLSMDWYIFNFVLWLCSITVIFMLIWPLKTPSHSLFYWSVSLKMEEMSAALQLYSQLPSDNFIQWRPKKFLQPLTHYLFALKGDFLAVFLRCSNIAKGFLFNCKKTCLWSFKKLSMLWKKLC